jgi:hypothetical protein
MEGDDMSDDAMSDDAKSDDVTNTSIGFVFDAFGDRFKIVDSRLDVVDDLMYKLSSKIEALDIGIVYSVDLYNKRINTIIKNYSIEYNEIDRKLRIFKGVMLLITSFSFLINIVLLVFILGM